MQQKNSTEINQKSFSPETPVIPPPTPERHLSWPWLVVGAVVVLLLIGWVGWTYYKSTVFYNQYRICCSGENFNQPPQTDITSDWQTYTNEEYGFEFKYPLNVKVASNKLSLSEYGLESEANTVMVGPVKIIILISESSKNIVRDYFDIYNRQTNNNLNGNDGPYVDCSLKPLNNNGSNIEGVYCLGEGGPVYYGWAMVQRAEIFIAAPIPRNRENNFKDTEEFFLFLSTFRFLESGDKTSDWKIYRNNKYNFTFKYPNDWIIEQDFLMGDGFYQGALKDDWLLFFDTGINDKDGRDILVHLFIRDANNEHARVLCEQNISCKFDNPIFHDDNITIYNSLFDAYDWYVGNKSNLISIQIIFDLNEGIGYIDRLGMEIRNSLEGEILQVIKTIEFLN